ncbi:MAG: galactose oxidase early set domain-containing protein [Pseudomonadota bacterium]|nr:galactose oxidase early set domain-containing protein [Pseudomonadota bacterium]
MPNRLLCLSAGLALLLVPLSGCETETKPVPDAACEPTTETCDGVDNDCDGQSDEDFLVGEACDGTDADIFREGVYACATPIAASCTDPNEEEDGSWEAAFPWPSADLQTEAVHLIQLPNGWVYSMYHGSDVDAGAGHHFPNEYDAAALWNPATGVTLSVPLLEAGDGNLFCSGHSLLADGRVFFTGGDVTGASPPEGVDTSFAFDGVADPTGDAYAPWAYVGQMVGGVRWYPNNTSLADGSVLITSGATILDPYTINDAVEVYLPGADRFELRAPQQFFDMYPWMFLLPDGRVLSSGQEAQARVWNPATDAWTPVAAERPDKRVYGTSAMLLLDGGDVNSASDVLILGGCTGRRSARCCLDELVTENFGDCEVPDPEEGSESWECVATAELLTGLEGDAPAWLPVGDMADERGHGIATLLPDGTIIVTGGERNDCTPAPQPEIYHPDTRAFTLAAPYPEDSVTGTLWPFYRGDYHTSALLLPDGRVLVSGGDTDALDANGPTAWIYGPPYLDLPCCPQPEIVSAPSELRYGEPFSLEVNSGEIDHLVLLRPGSMTHDFAMDQRGVRLDVDSVTEEGGTWQVSADAPVAPELAPPGHYMLFAISVDGVPSVAEFVRILPGDCSERACDDPPDPHCSDATTLRTFDVGGSCFEGSCQYISSLETCIGPDGAAAACDAGACTL